MRAKFICVLLTIAVARALPSSTVIPKNDEPTCDQKISWYRDLTNKMKIMYVEYKGKSGLAKLATSELNKLDVEFRHFESVLSPILAKYDVIVLTSIANKQTICDNIDKYRVATLNLTRAAMTLKSNASNIIDHSEFRKERKDSLNKILTTMVNFLFEVGMSENYFKDLEPLMKEAEKQATENTELEKLYKMTENGVEVDQHLFDITQEDKDFDKFLQDFSNTSEIDAAERALTEREREHAEEREREHLENNDYKDYDDGMPLHLNPGRAVVNAFKHPALPLTIIGIILIVICAMFVWNWVRPDQWIQARYRQMP